MNTEHPLGTAPACRQRRLAQSSLVSVDLCSCGAMQLHLGAITLRMTPEAVASLVETLGAAVTKHAALSVDERDVYAPVFHQHTRGDA